MIIGKRTVQFMSKQLVELIIVPSYVISIGDPKESINFPVEHISVLRLEFDDIQEHLHGYKLFSIIQAKQIIDWIKTVPVGSNVIVHCHAGISRSAAVAQFLIKDYNFELIKTPRHSDSFDLANGFVYGTLRTVNLDKQREIALITEAEYERVCKQAPSWL